MRLHCVDTEEELFGDRAVGGGRGEGGFAQRAAERGEHLALCLGKVNLSACAGNHEGRLGLALSGRPEDHDRLAEAEPVTVAEAVAAPDALAVQEGPIAGQSVVGDGPVALQALKLGMQAGDLTVPVESKVVLRADGRR